MPPKVGELQQKITELEARILQLSTQLNAVRADLASTKELLDNAVEDNAALAAQNALLLSEKEQLLLDKESLEIQVAMLTEQRDTALAAHAQCQIDLAACRGTPLPPAAVNCEWDAWGAWQFVSETACVDGSKTVTEKRVRTIKTAAANGGLPCTGPFEETRTRTEACTVTPPPPVGQFSWTTIPGTELQPILPTVPGQGHPGAYVAAWNTMDVATDADGNEIILFPANGGDGDYRPSVAAEIPLNGAPAVNLTPGLPQGVDISIAASYDTMPNGDIRPVGHHTYGGAVWMKHNRTLVMIGGSMWLGPTDLNTFAFDYDTRKWALRAPCSVTSKGIVATYDAVQKRAVYIAPGDTVWEYRDDRHTMINQAPYWWWDQTSVAIRGRELWIISTHGFDKPGQSLYANVHAVVMNLDTGAFSPRTIQGFVNMGRPGFQYDPTLDKFILWDGSLQIIDPVALKAEIHSDPSWPQQVAGVNGTWGRFRRLSDGRYVLVRAFNLPVDVLTIGEAGTGTGGGTTPGGGTDPDPDPNPQPQPPLGTKQRLNVGFGKDGFPNWTDGNEQLMVKFKRPGGDVLDKNMIENGPTPWAHFDVAALGPAQADVTELVRFLIAHPEYDACFLLIALNGTIKVSATEGGAGPALLIKDGSGERTLAPVVDGTIDPSTGRYDYSTSYTIDGTSRPVSKWNLSSINGLISAKLRINVIGDDYVGFASGNHWHGDVHLLLMPEVREPEDCPLDPTPGLVAEAGEAGLAAHPDVVLTIPFTSEQAFANATDAPQGAYLGPDPTVGSFGLPRNEFLKWPDGKDFVRVNAGPNMSVAKGLFWCSMPSGRPYQFEPDNPKFIELYFQYYLTIGADFQTGCDPNQGLKLPGLSGSYDGGWGNVNVWLAQRGLDVEFLYRNGWDARMLVSAPSKANPGLVRPMIYWHGGDAPFNVDAKPFILDCLWRMGARYKIEQRVRLNTKRDGVWQSDGAVEIWTDRHKVFSNLQVKVRTHEWATFLSIPYFLIFHGGMSPPLGPFHVDIGGCTVATRYIG